MAKDIVEDIEDDDDTPEYERGKDLDLINDEDIREHLLDIFKDIDKGYANQAQRSNDILDYWDAYNCILGDKQFYNGNSKIFVPIIRNAIEARQTRFVNQLFPRSERHVEVVTAEEEIPHSLIALVEHYINDLKLRTQIIPALIRSGDIEGQYTVYVDWEKISRTITSRETRPVEIDGMEAPELGEIEEMIEEEIKDGKPAVEVISDPDLLVLPQTCDTLEQALERGGSVTIIRRWSKAVVKQKMEDGVFDEDAASFLIESMAKREGPGMINVAKDLASSAGIKLGEGGKYVQGYETWTKLKVDGEWRICRGYYGGEDQILGVEVNPYWCDRLPILSAPVKKVPGLFKGMSMIGPGVLDMQVAANDAINEGMDSAAFALMPIIMSDPEKNPRIGSMILDLAAVWEVDPNSTKFAQFPALWKDAFMIVAEAKQEILQSLSVNPAMMPQQSGSPGRKRNQAEIANEQQVDLLTTADAVTNIEGEILSPLVERILAYDHQFRDEELLIRSFGELGMKATMEEIEPIQMNKRIVLRWFGVEAARNAAQVQQQISAMNVMRGIPPEMYQGYELNIAPLLVQLTENVFGPRLGPLIFKSKKDALAADPEQENYMLKHGFEVHVHSMDNDQEHIQVHLQCPPGPQRDAHINQHVFAMNKKRQLQAQQMMAQHPGNQGQPGTPGGAGPGTPGTPPPGAQVAGPHAAKQAPGAISQDQMGKAGAAVMPRKM